MTALVIWALPMLLWPFRTVLLPNAEASSKKRLGSQGVNSTDRNFYLSFDPQNWPNI